MFVKLVNGPRAGESVEMNYLDAKPLIEDGRAEFSFPPDPPALVNHELRRTSPPEIPAKKKKK